MSDVITFPNQKWMRLEPIWPQPYEITVQVVYNFLDWTVPRPAHLSVFEHKWLDRIVGYSNRDQFNYLNDTRSIRDARVTYEIYGQTGYPENVRWKKESSA